MAVEEVAGGVVGEVAATQIGLMLSGLFIVLLALVTLFSWLFGNTVEDFIEAKSEGKSITCQGWVKTYKVTAEDYEIVDNKIEFRPSIFKKSMNIADCSID